jgi:hypothetical protein
MKIDEQEVPTPVLAHWKQALDDASPAALKTLASVHPSLQSGFRPGKVPPAQLRTRAKAMLDTSGGLPEALRHLLVQQGLQRQLVCVLSEAAIEAHAASWADAVGRSAFFSVMLLDDRAAVRSVGFSQAEGWDGQGADELEATRARQTLTEEFGPFLRCVAPLVHRLPDASAPSGPGDDDLASPAAIGPSPSLASTDLSVKEHLPKTDATVLSARPPRPAQEKDLVLQLRAQRQEARRAQRACDEAQRERDRLAARLETTDTHLTEARAELRRLKDELRNTQARIDELVRDGVQAQLDARLRPWLAPAESLERAVHDLAEDTPAAQAEALLRRQAEIDRREGLRSALVAELHRTQAALAEVQRAQVDALNPLPQLPEMARRLQAHEAALRARLDASSSFLSTSVRSTVRPAPAAAVDPAPGPLARLHQTLAAAATLDDLAQIRRQVQAAAPLGLLTADESAQAHTLLHEAAARLYDRSVVASGVVTAPPLDGRDFPLQALQRALAAGQACVLVVDGHNVLHLLPEWFRPHQDDHARIRRALADRLLGLAARHAALRVELWFDGPAHDTQALSDQVRLHFSGGTGRDRADHAIVAHLRHLKSPGLQVRAAVRDRPVAVEPTLVGASDVQRVFVVTADGDVRHESVALGALVLLPVELGILLK